jgi:hypothetical protein
MDQRLYEAVKDKFASQLQSYIDAKKHGCEIQPNERDLMERWLSRSENPITTTADLAKEARDGGHKGLKYGPHPGFCAVCHTASRKANFFGKDFSDWKISMAGSAELILDSGCSDPIEFVILIHQIYHNKICSALRDIESTPLCPWRGQYLFEQPWTPESIAEHFLFHVHHPRFWSIVRSQIADFVGMAMYKGLITRAENPDTSMSTADINVFKILLAANESRFQQKALLSH